MITDELITLRAMEPSDAEAMYLWENDTMLWSDGDNNTPFSRTTIRKFIDSVTEDIYSSKQLRLMIELNIVASLGSGFNRGTSLGSESNRNASLISALNEETPPGSVLSAKEISHGRALSAKEISHGSVLSAKEISHGRALSAKEISHGRALSAKEISHGSVLSAKEISHGSVLSAKEISYGRALSAKEISHGRALSAKEISHGRALNTDETLPGSALNIEALPGSDVFSTSETIGAIDLYDFNPLHRRAGVGILIYQSAHRNKGYGLRSVRLMSEYVFNMLNMKQLYAHVAISNGASIAMFHKAGFTDSGILRQWQVNDSDVLIMQLIR